MTVPLFIFRFFLWLGQKRKMGIVTFKWSDGIIEKADFSNGDKVKIKRTKKDGIEITMVINGQTKS